MEYVLYLRASTQRQGLSGLGLEGQRLIAHRFLQPGDRILSEYIEVESGRKNNRPEMAKAIVETRSASATLLVAEMARLARSVYFKGGQGYFGEHKTWIGSEEGARL